jgi:hypothetical protein
LRPHISIIYRIFHKLNEQKVPVNSTLAQFNQLQQQQLNLLQMKMRHRHAKTPLRTNKKSDFSTPTPTCSSFRCREVDHQKMAAPKGGHLFTD